MASSMQECENVIVTDSDNSLRSRVFALLEKNHELKPKDLCKLMDLDYGQSQRYVRNLRHQWKCHYQNRQALKCLSFHNTRGWIYALKKLDRQAAVEAKGSVWQQTRAKNKMLLWKDRDLGRLEWHQSGRIKIWIKKPATWGRVKQLLANAFFGTGLIDDIEIFDLWASSARFKGSHLVYDTGERLPYSRIEMLKDSNGIIVKTGDVSHPTGIEIEFHYPDWAEKNELLQQQSFKALEQFSEFLRELSTPKNIDRHLDKNMVV